MPCVSSNDCITVIPLKEDLNVSIETSSSMSLETGGSIWHASMSLTNHLINNEHLVKDKIVMEIGAGCALPGLVSGVLGAKAVILTDIPEQVAHIQQNVDLNSSNCGNCEFVCVPFMFGDTIESLK